MRTGQVVSWLPAAVPVEPDDQEARNLLREELAKGIYREAEPSLLERAWTAFLNWLGDLLGQIRSVDAGLGTVLLAVGAVLLIAVAVLLIKPRLNARKSAEPTVFHAESRLSAQTHRDLADTAAGAGDWDEALTERFRAITRSAEERVILDEQPGRTAAEVAHQLRGLFDALATQLDWLAVRFNEVHYGARPATEEDHRRAVELDRDLERSRPRRRMDTQQWSAPV